MTLNPKNMAQDRAPEQDSYSLSGFLAANEKIVLGIVIAIGLILRIWHLFEARANDPFFSLPAVDPKVYHEWAITIAKGNFLGDEVFFLSPLYPYFLAIIYTITGPGFLVGKLVQMLLGTMSCVLIYFIGKRVFDNRVGFLAALIFATYLPSIFYEGVLLVSGLQTPINLLCVLVLLYFAKSPGYRGWIVCGICLGLSALARPNVLLFGVFVLIWIFVMDRSQADIKKALFRALVFSAGIGLAVFPVTLRNLAVGGDPVLISSQGGVNLYIGNGPDATGTFAVPRLFPMTRADNPLQQKESYEKFAEESRGRELKPSEISDFWTRRTWDHISNNPGKWIGLLVHKLGLFINHYEVGNSREFDSSRGFSTVLRLPLPVFGFIAPLALLGMAVGLKRIRQAFFIYAMIATYAISLAIFFVLAHYRMPVTPFFILFAAYAIFWLIDTLKKRRHRLLIVATLGLATAITLVHIDSESISGHRFMIQYNLGNKYRLMKRTDLAISAYKQSIAANPNYISAYNNLGLAYEAEEQNLNKAIKTWEKVLKMARQRNDEQYIERARRHIRELRKFTERQRQQEKR